MGIDPDGWRPPLESPAVLVPRIAPISLFLVHGDEDHHLPVEHARWLVVAAPPPVDLWVEPGFGHAESAAGPGLLARIAVWSRGAVAGSGPSGTVGTTAGSAGSVRMRA